MQAALVDRARHGDHEAFGVLATGAIDRLYAIARLILRHTEFAEDATRTPWSAPGAICRRYVGLSASDAAEALDIPVGTAKSRLHHALDALRAALAADERTAVGGLRNGRTA